MTQPKDHAGHDHDHGHGHDHGSPFIQHHYDDAQHQFDSGKLGIWFFLVQEVLFFSALFVAYILYRHHHPEIYEYASHYLDTKMGAINTVVLIVSSLSAAWAVRAAQLGQRRNLILCLVITIVCAFGFMGIKYVEYSHKIHEGILFGKHFDPCVASGGAALPTKKNQCEGTKSTIVWDFGSREATAGCLVGDQEPFIEGEQLDCVISDGAREIAACPIPEGGIKGHGKLGNPQAPCYTMVEYPALCPAGKIALVHYGDSQVRASTQITAQCAAAVPVPNRDNFAEAQVETRLGVAAVSKAAPKSKHDRLEEFANGPPPPNTNMFFSIYFAMTGLHGLHVLVGIGIFIWLLIRALKGHFTPTYFGPIDYAALYWHLVDLIWIFLFPLLYLIH